MLLSFLRTLPFLLVRVVLGVLDILVTLYATLWVEVLFTDFISRFVTGFFLEILTPMGYLLGLGVSMLVCYYVIGLAAYFFKLAHIIALTSVTLEYKPTNASLTFYAVREAKAHFSSLALSYVSTKVVVSALKDLKNTIMKHDILARFKEPKNALLRLVKELCTAGINNTLDMVDEIIVSYTWFTGDLYRRSSEYKKSKKAKSVANRAKVQAKHMLEGVGFIIRVTPHLMLNSLIYESLFIILKLVFLIVSVSIILKVLGLSWITVLLMFVSYRAIVQIFSYTIVDSFKLIAYLHAFYRELSELEPFSVKDFVDSLVRSIPGLSSVANMSGQKIDVRTGEGTSPVLQQDISDTLRKSLKNTLNAFNVQESEILEKEKTVTKSEQKVDILKEMEAETIPEVMSGESVNAVKSEIELELDAEEIQLSELSGSSPFDFGPRGSN